jgi:hypothetical protein
MSDNAPTPQSFPSRPEALAVARETAGAFGRMVEEIRDGYKLQAQEAVAKARELCQQPGDDSILHKSPEAVSWIDLNILGDRDPELALRRWEEIKQAAREELQCGFRAARSVEEFEAAPWQRAQFGAIYRELGEQWKASNGIERQLVETMAVAHAKWLFWLARETFLCHIQAIGERRSPKEEWHPPRVSDAEAFEQAAMMAERYNRIYLRTLRALRDLRRYTPAVIVQNAGQVNVAGQQVNVATGQSPS